MKKGDIRKQEILNTAEQLFCRNGYEQTSIQDILDRLKISKGSFYHHYVSKESLLEGICSRRAEQIYQTAADAVKEESPTAAKLNILLSGMIPFRDEKLSFFLMLLPTFRLPEGKMVRVSYCEALEQLFLPDVIRLLQEGQQSGELACPEPEETAGLILLTVSRLWVRICDIMTENEEKHTENDLSACLRLTDCYRRAVERMILLPYGSISLIDIPALGYLTEQIHCHWS